jgi:hypothetical protein
VALVTASRLYKLLAFGAMGLAVAVLLVWLERRQSKRIPK